MVSLQSHVQLGNHKMTSKTKFDFSKNMKEITKLFYKITLKTLKRISTF